MSETDTHRDRAWQRIGWEGEPNGPPRLDGDRLCLDFANTVGGRATDHVSEFLKSYAVLVSWTWYVGVLDDEHASRLHERARQEPEVAADMHRRAIVFRDTIYRLFFAIASGDEVERSDMDAVHRIYRTALDHRELQRQGERFDWIWTDSAEHFERPLWPIAISAIEVLLAGNLDRIKICPGGDGHSCQWLFFDTTRNHNRHWCSMAVCGGTAKSRRQVARKQAARSQ